MKTGTSRGVTIIELTIVLVIISILTSISLGIYTNHVRQAEIVKAKLRIKELELAVTRYEVDLGVFPPSYSKSSGVATSGTTTTNPGCGYLILALMRSMNNDPLNPSSTRWTGPYINVEQNELMDTATGGPVTSATDPANVSLKDPWGRPYNYVRCTDYATAPEATKQVNTPFTGYYNPTTVQIYSVGPNGSTSASPERGLDTDDINNFNNV
ncbi:MAG TPA: prepilin-type N-terminal cleavage/methylation domain-containing protein [Candidatus Sumerlaeota bacterium]|mgnify:CR=1 FL=1|nr:prepilin-type N-terminal cleavage/methylation domain-containing protein [Candidatus Sumerlaeota bacterium]HPS00999.1 prepilin-type N-terminal cleavage/methylation domain-containing protein [Candidatus Sumerlaeota bacterium]